MVGFAEGFLLSWEQTAAIGYATSMEAPPFDYAQLEYPLAPATFYRVGGPAHVALLPRNPEEIIEAFQWMRRQPEPKLILGRGSNVLISDRGFPGIVLFTSGLNTIEELGNGLYRVECGVNLDRLVREILVVNNYAGTGALAGIPGSVGGAIYMNAGTVNGATCQFLERVTVVGPTGLRTVTIDSSLYSYRGQVFCHSGDLIVEGIFHFEKTGDDQKAVYDHYMSRRREKQPQGYCCGSVFKNPPNDHAGRLIEACGLKGTRRGGAVISPQHANFIMNEKNATFDDIVALIELCKARVREQFSIELQEEVCIIR